MSNLSAGDLAVLTRYFDAWNRRDIDAWVGFTHPDVELVPTAFWSSPGASYNGHTGLRTYAHEMFGRFPYLRAEPPELRDLGDRILGRGTVVAGADRASATAREIACVFTIRDGQIYRVQAFPSEAEALSAAGQQSTDHFRLLFRSASDAMFLIDDAGVFLDANASTCELFGLSLDQLCGRALFEFTAPEAVDRAKKLLRDIHARGQCSGDLELVQRDGERRSVLLSAKAEFVPGCHLVLLTPDPGTASGDGHSPSGPRLTAREHEVFRLLALGMTGSEIAEQLVLSPHTVRSHVENGIARLEARNRLQALAIALTSGELKR